MEFDTLICIGDFNTDLDNPSRFIRALNVFMSENDLQKVGLDSIGDTFSWASDDVTRTSWIDYALVAPSREKEKCNFSISKDGPWISDHLPVGLSYHNNFFGNSLCKQDRQCVKDNGTRNLDWTHASVKQLTGYADLLSQQFNSISYEIAEAAVCNEVHKCNHVEYIKDYYSKISDAMIFAANASIPHATKIGVRRPVWNSTLKQSKIKAQSAYRTWKSEGKPRQGMAYRQMCDSRNEFKSELKRWKRDKELTLGKRMVDDLKDGNQDCFWRKLRRGYEGQSQNIYSSRVGDAYTNDDILTMWKDHFGQVANSHDASDAVRFQRQFLDELKAYESLCEQNRSDLRVSFNDVRKAAGKLQNRKAAGTDGISAEHIKHGGSDLLVHLSIVFQAIMKHGCVPDQWKESTIVPLLKDRNGDKSDPDNYRGITLSSIVSKMFERLLLLKYGHLLESNQLQFGFTSCVGCAECSYLVQESVDQ